MSLPFDIQSALGALCRTAARALKCDVRARVGDGPDVQARFGGGAGPERSDPAGRDVLRLPFGSGAGTLRLERPASAGGWSAEETELAASFAEVADSYPLRPGPPSLIGDEAFLLDPAAYFRTVVDYSDAMIWVHDPDTGAFLVVSQTACDVAGYSVEEYMKLGPAGVAWGEPPHAPADVARHIETALSSDAPHRFEFCARHRAGYPIAVEVTLRRLEINGVPRLLATGRSMDAQKAAEAELLSAKEALEERVAERTAELARATEALEQHAVQLALANEELERRVAERTAELAVANESLRRSEEHFRALIENGSDLLMVSRPDGPLTYVSPSVERMLGYSPEELLGASPGDLIHPDDLGVVWDALGRIAAEPGSVHQFSPRLRHKDGSWRFLESLGRTVSPTSAAEGIVANSRDVTEQRAAERAVQRSEEHFRRLIEHSYDMVQVLDGEGRVTYTGPSVHHLLGYTPEELTGAPASDFTHPDDRAAAGAMVARVLAEPGVSRSLEYRVRHRDGSWRWMEVFGRTLSPTSAASGVVLNARDVTERKAAQRAVEESEARYRSLIDAAQDVIAVVDGEGVYRFMSPSVRHVLGFEPEEMVGRSAFEFMHPADIETSVPRLGKVMTDPGTVECVEYRNLHKDGSWRHLESRGRTILPDSAAAGAVALVRDVTDRVEAEAALREAKAEAEQARLDAERANLAKSEFLSRMSHELRTPMNSILGFAQVLEDVEMPAEYRAGVRHILSGGRHLLRLINEVLDIARIETDQQALSLEPVRLGTAIREAVDMVRPLAAARGVRVVEMVDLTADRYVYADRQRLAQVALNLLSNAVKYNRAPGTASITYEAVRDGGGAEWLRVRVADEGDGIADEHRDRLFVPFERLGAEHTGVEGTGLGLALSRHLARAMGGELALERTSPRGSVFRIDLRPASDPLADRDAVLSLAEAGAGESASAGTLLYVEDNLANLALVQTILLPRPSWRLIPALQGGLGIELAAEHAPDVILLDLHLPDMPGREVLQRLRANPRTAHIPIVVISADATAKTAESLAAAGADAFLTKPLSVKEFVETVERFLTPPTTEG